MDETLGERGGALQCKSCPDMHARKRLSVCYCVYPASQSLREKIYTYLHFHVFTAALARLWWIYRIKTPVVLTSDGREKTAKYNVKFQRVFTHPPNPHTWVDLNEFHHSFIIEVNHSCYMSVLIFIIFIRACLLTRCSKKLEDRCAFCSNCASHTPRQYAACARTHTYTVADPSTAQPVRASPRKKPGGAIPSLFVYRARSFAQFIFDIQWDQTGIPSNDDDSIPAIRIGRFLSRDLRDNKESEAAAANKLILGTDKGTEREEVVRIVTLVYQVGYKKKFWKERRTGVDVGRCCRREYSVCWWSSSLCKVNFFPIFSFLDTSNWRRVRAMLPWKALETFAPVF